jgi:hypothetical protein
LTQASAEAKYNWEIEIIFCGWKAGNIFTGGRTLTLPESSPVKRSYELFGRIPHKSWDQPFLQYVESKTGLQQIFGII